MRMKVFWQVCKRPVVDLVGVSGKVPERFLGPLGGLLGAPWEPFGTCRECLVDLLGPLGGFLGASWGRGGVEISIRFPYLGLLWGLLGARLGCLERLLDRLGTLLGRLGALSGVSWAVLA